jgi:hypothetical protein
VNPLTRRAPWNAFPAFLEFYLKELAKKKERSYVKFRDGATPHNVNEERLFYRQEKF